MEIRYVNHVSLIGQISSELKEKESLDGAKYIAFSMKTRETFLDENGNSTYAHNWHSIIAHGRLAKVLKHLGEKGSGLAVEGKLISRFYKRKGGLKKITEIEANDLVIL